MTAIPNWTGRMPLQGRPLAGLVVLWMVGRFAVLFSTEIGIWPAMLLDLAFPVVLLLALLREIAAGRAWRNLPVIVSLGLLLAANALSHIALLSDLSADLGLRLGISVFASLVALVGGRAVPSFTRNWLAKRKATRRPARQNWVDRVAIGATAVASLTWTIWPDLLATAVFAGIASLALALRLVRWCGLATWREPLLVVLHIGYAWLVVGFGALALASIVPVLTETAALHALTAGAMGAMTLAIMTRTTLSHTGRKPKADVATALCFALVVLAAALRVVAPVWPTWTLALYGVASALWIAAFLVFLMAHGAKLWHAAPRT